MPRTQNISIPKFLPDTGEEDPRHRKLLDYARRLITMSESVISTRWKQWQETDRRHRVFVDVTETDTFTGRQKRPHDVKLVLPLSYAIHYTNLTYLYTVFTAKERLFPLEGRRIDDVKPAQLMEELLEYDIQRQQGRMVLYTWLNDTLRYGLGVVQDEWQETFQKKTVRTREPVQLFGYDLGTREVTKRDWQRVYNGNRTYNIDPYLYLPDPRVAGHRVQDGDFVAYGWFRSWTQLKEQERAGVYQNVDAIAQFDRAKITTAFPQSTRLEVLGLPAVFDQTLVPDDRGFVYGHTLWLKIVPSDFDLGGNDPELWVLAMANYDTIIQAERWDYDHGEFPVGTLVYTPDGYSPVSQGATEIIQPICDVMDWLIGSHVDNIKKALNDMLVVDPSRINLDDLSRPGPAKWIRLTQNAWGSDVRTALSQLPIQDMTASHMTNIQMLMDWATKATGALDPMLGMQPRAKQQATVFAGLVQMAASRHKVIAQIMSEMGLLPWARRLVSNIQQHQDEETFLRVTGEKAKMWGLDPYQTNILKVSPEQIQGQFDFPVHTGDIPPDPNRDAEFWMNAMMAMAKLPPLMQTFDLIEFFKQAAYAKGVKNIDAFRVRAQVRPDQQVQAGLQAGNLAALPAGGNGGGPGAGAPAGGGVGGNLGSLTPVAGMGTTLS